MSTDTNATAADIEQLETDVTAEWANFPAPVIRTKIREAKASLDWFTEEASRWFYHVLEELSDGCFKFQEPRTAYPIEDVITAFEKAQGEALVEQGKWWEDDPKGFLKANPHLDNDGFGPTDHPWEMETLSLCYRWIREATLYRLWQFKEDVEAKALEVLQENLLYLATAQDDGKGIGWAASDTFGKKVKALRERLFADNEAQRKEVFEKTERQAS